MTTSAKSKNEFPTLPRLALAESVGERGGRGGNASSAFQFLPAWQREHSRRLHRLCASVDDAISRGETFQGSLVKIARRCNGKPYRSDPSRAFRCSVGTLRRLFYVWIREGRTVDAFKLHYRTPQKIRAQELAAFLAAARMPAVQSFDHARQRLAYPRATASAYRYALPAHHYKVSCEAFALRRHAAADNRRADRLLKTLRVYPQKKVASA